VKVYHGSYLKIDNVDLSQCKPNKDFGQGFYVTKFRHHAETWATIIGRKSKVEGVVSEFEYNENKFTQFICKIKRFEKYDGEWLDFVVMNRDENHPSPAHNYDIVEGPVADDKVQNKIKPYLEEKISKTDLLEELKYHEETHQICFCTLNSLQTLKPVGETPASTLTHIGEPLLEKLMLDKEIDEQQATDLFYNSKTFAQLADETTKLYQKPWQEIYALLKQEMEGGNPP